MAKKGGAEAGGSKGAPGQGRRNRSKRRAVIPKRCCQTSFSLETTTNLEGLYAWHWTNKIFIIYSHTPWKLPTFIFTDLRSEFKKKSSSVSQEEQLDQQFGLNNKLEQQHEEHQEQLVSTASYLVDISRVVMIQSVSQSVWGHAQKSVSVLITKYVILLTIHLFIYNILYVKCF